MNTTPTTVYQLSQYTPLEYFITHVDLEIDLSVTPAQSKARLSIKPNSSIQNRSQDLRLDGQFMVLNSVLLDNRTLNSDDFELLNDALIIKNIPQHKEFFIETTQTLTECTDLFGLYESEGIFLVKAETEGLRRVFYCLDRPDNLSTYTTTIIANKQKYPVLLSNGTLTAKHDLLQGLHSVTWSDTLPKPTYLFALVAGNLNYSSSEFTTHSGRKIPIEFYVSSQDLAKCDFAKEVVKESIAWDEKVFNLDCDLAQHMVAGVDKYASGASEPTGLNLFNTENLFATPQIKTDLGILRVLEVVAHEYFHYWSGNRVTIRDWFNLPFKEGLTTFRAALLFEDLFGTSVARLLHGKNFDERAPRQSSYTAVRSLYTLAAYEKSADIFRMMMLLIGKEAFTQNLGMFFKEHDGQAVTLEVVLEWLTQKTEVNVNAFLPWFTESGIPKVHVTEEYQADQQRYILRFNTVNGQGKPIPVLMGLLNQSGSELVSDRILLIDQPEMEFQWDDMPKRPIPSLLRDFSAPVHLTHTLSNDALLVLMRHDTNLYNRCEAAKRLIINLVSGYCTEAKLTIPTTFLDVYRTIIYDESIEPWIRAELLTLNSEEELITAIPKASFELIAKARLMIQQILATELQSDWPHLLTHEVPQTPIGLFNIHEAGMRRLTQVYYSFQKLTNSGPTASALVEQFNLSLDKNMTQTISALSLLGDMGCDLELNRALEQFYNFWNADTHAINYWFRIQASMHTPQVVAKVQQLIDHPAFDILNPNKIHALLGSFINNPYGFHNASGEGYTLVAKMILVLDKLNPPLAANLTLKFGSFGLYDERRQHMMRDHLMIISQQASSVDVKNAAKKALN